MSRWGELSKAEAAAVKRKAFVDVSASRSTWDRAVALVEEWGLEAVWAVDGAFFGPSRAHAPDKEGTAARAAVRHDGVVVSGEMHEGDGESAFMCEFAAQLDAVSTEECSRLLILFDCTSPVDALFAFLRTHDRQKVDT